MYIYMFTYVYMVVVAMLKLCIPFSCPGHTVLPSADPGQWYEGEVLSSFVSAGLPVVSRPYIIT